MSRKLKAIMKSGRINLSAKVPSSHLVPDFLCAFFDFSGYRPDCDMPEPKRNGSEQLQLSDSAREIRSAFSVCFRKNFAAWTMSSV